VHLSLSIFLVFARTNSGNTILFYEIGYLAVSMSIIHVAIPVNLIGLKKQKNWDTYLELLKHKTVTDKKKWFLLNKLLATFPKKD
jgi:hypothetical protein